MTFTLKKLLTLIAGALGVISTFLPWYKVSFWGTSVSTNAYGDRVWIAIIVIIVAALLILMEALPEKTLKGINKAIIEKGTLIRIVLGGLMVGFGLLGMILYLSESYGMGQMSIGWFLMMVAGIGAIVLNAIKSKQLNKVVIGEEKKSATKKTDKK